MLALKFKQYKFYFINEKTFFKKKKVNNLLHRAQWQSMPIEGFIYGVTNPNLMQLSNMKEY